MSPFRRKCWVNVAAATIYIIWVAQMNIGWYFRDQTECFDWRCLKHRLMLFSLKLEKKNSDGRQMICHLPGKAFCRPHLLAFILSIEFFSAHCLHSSSADVNLLWPRSFTKVTTFQFNFQLFRFVQYMPTVSCWTKLNKINTRSLPVNLWQLRRKDQMFLT